MPPYNTSGVFGTSPDQVSELKRRGDSLKNFYKPIEAAGPNESAYQSYLDNLETIDPKLFGAVPGPQISGQTSNMELLQAQQQQQQQQLGQEFNQFQPQPKAMPTEQPP